ncbi:hypothetical protein RI129_000042 [Pyrocoelia pectoralis]|uniref:Uncharacterized protein n=1 Tax=Pyrocoelia pectoralis TaxID=417401 RepID=A0AAN7ZEC9_9COLE
MMPLSTSPLNNDSTTNLTKASEESESQSLSSPDVEVQTSRFPGTRFKVVKVETSRPFRRGRWWCMDYLDESPYAPKNAFTYKSSGGLEICSELQYTMTATSLQTQNSVEFGTNLNSTDPKLICSVSELHSSYYPHPQKDKLVNHVPKVQSHLHVPTPHSNLKNKNGAIPVCIDHNLYCKPSSTHAILLSVDPGCSLSFFRVKLSLSYLKRKCSHSLSTLISHDKSILIIDQCIIKGANTFTVHERIKTKFKNILNNLVSFVEYKINKFYSKAIVKVFLNFVYR